jgi:ketosteroid isomerase-like protein
MRMNTQEKLALIRRYYDGCSAGDVAIMRDALDDNVVHYFLSPNPGSAPVRGAERLAKYWRRVQRLFAARWVIDAIVAEDDAAVIEWTMFHTPKPGATRVTLRGAEFYRFNNGLISEIRAYYQQLDRSTELDGFDYGSRGYSQIGKERSALHEPPIAVDSHK